MRKKLHLKLTFLFTVFCLLFSVLYGCQNRQLYRGRQVLMGTFVEVISTDKRAARIAFKEIKRIEDLLSKYKEDSEIARLNKSGRLNVSEETLYVIRKANEYWLLSEGAFDITVGPLMDLWGFTDKKYNFPEKEKIKDALSLVGMDKIIFNDSQNLVEFKVPGMKIDLGAIAKGYALDCAVDKLKKAGIRSCLINMGGQVYCLGDKFGKPWKVAIRDPGEENGDYVDYLELKNKSVATSGDYEQYFIKDRERYSHIFNPKTGYPADSGVVSVTVVAPDGLTADALATAILVLGKKKGEELAKKIPGVETRVIEEKDLRP